MKLPWLSSLVLLVVALSCGDDAADSAADLGVNPDKAGTGTSRIHGYIRGDSFPRLIIELDAVKGQEPPTAVEPKLVAGFEGVLDKPGGIEVVHDGALDSKGADHAWTFDELDAMAKATFDLDVPDDTIKMHVLFVDGHYEEDSADGKVLGLAWANTHLVMFQQTITEGCQSVSLPKLGGVVSEKLCESTELGVWTHEMGHLIGLVDNGLPMTAPHRDPDAEHGAHDESKACIMYWAYEGQAIVDTLRDRLLGGDETPLGFDAACLADIAGVK